jgi:hypothetical protein
MQTYRALDELANEIISTGTINAEQVKEIRLRIFSETRILERLLEDGIVDRGEAETLFSINDALSAGQYDASWRDLFVEAITSHVLKDEISPDVLDEEEAQFILKRIQKDGKIDPVEIDLLVNVSASVRRAPPFFHRFVLDALKALVLQDGLVGEEDVRKIRSVICGPGSSSGQSIDDLEKAWLREIDDQTARRKNHPSWGLLKLEVGFPD